MQDHKGRATKKSVRRRSSGEGGREKEKEPLELRSSDSPSEFPSYTPARNPKT